MEIEKNCLICSKSNFRVLHLIKEIIYRERFYICQCKNCHFIFTSPIFSSKELSRFYPQNYYSLIPKQQDLFSSQGTSLRRKMSKKLKILLLKKYGYNFDSEDFFSPFLQLFLPFYKYIVSEIYPENKKDGYLLDLGCGCGEYILLLKQLGWKVYGIDINPQAVINARKLYGLDVFCGELLDVKFQDNFFDTITLHAVLEHISEPIITLQELHRILKKNGRIIISVPNIWNWERILFRKFWWGWDIPRHLWHFSPKTLEKLLKNYGFKEIKIQYLSDMYDFPKNIRNMLSAFFPKLEKNIHSFFDCDKWRFITKYLILPIGIISMLFGITEKFVIIARK